MGDRISNSIEEVEEGVIALYIERHFFPIIQQALILLAQGPFAVCSTSTSTIAPGLS
jgi:hypothetical protein